MGKAKVLLRASECQDMLVTHQKGCIVQLPVTTANVSLDFRSKSWIKDIKLIQKFYRNV